MSKPQRSDGPLRSLWELLQKWFYKPDLQAIRIVLGAIQAHYLKIGDPAWLFIVAPPGSGKTAMSIMGAATLPQMHLLSDITENTFLSGFHGHQQPGLLERLGPVQQQGNTYITQGDGIFSIKDFTTVLSMRREKRAAILGQLREVHDGQYSKHFGTGVTKVWKGRVAVIAAVTPALDRHYSIFNSLGERFLQVRSHRPDSEEAGEWAINQQGQEEKIRTEARGIIQKIFAAAPKAAPKLSKEMLRRIAALSEVVAKARTHVYRSAFGNREMEHVPEPEANTRIAKGLAAIARGIAALNQHEEVGEEEFEDIVRVAFDSIPDNRRRLLKAIIEGRSPESVPMAKTVRGRELEELDALGLLSIDATDEFKLDSSVRKLLDVARIGGESTEVSEEAPTASSDECELPECA